MNAQQSILIQRLEEADLSTKRFLKVGAPWLQNRTDKDAIDGDKAAYEPAWEQTLYGPESLDSFPRWGICGKDYLVLIDCDDPRIDEAIAKILPPTLEAKSPKRGLSHRYYVVCGEHDFPNKRLFIAGVVDEKGRPKPLGEIRSSNEYLVAPGTTIRYYDKQTGELKTGIYTITENRPIARMEYAEFLEIIKPHIEQGNSGIAQTITPEEMAEGVAEGHRHPKALSYAGKLVRLGMDVATAATHLNTWNQTFCKPPLPDKELKNILKAVYGYSAKERGVSYEEAKKGYENLPTIVTNPENKEERKNESQADRAVKLCLEEGVEFFCDQHRTPYARVTLTTNATNATNTNSQTQTEAPTAYKAIYRLRDTEFKAYVAHLMYDREHKVIGAEALSAALNVLHFKAISNQQRTLYNRVAPDPEGNGLWLDMADERRRAYHITKDGWSLEVDVPTLFRRYEHQRPLPEAVRGGDPWKILDYVNLGKTVSVQVTETASQALVALVKKYEQKKLLLLVQNISSLFPDIPHPVSIMYGCAGTFKSTSQCFMRGIIDPSSVPTFGMPKDATALIQNLEHHYMPIYDNLSTIPDWMSNSLCRAVTGEGQEVRQLYTDDGVIIREFRRCLSINGLNIPAQKGDLLNRAALFETVPMPEERRTLEELNAAYEKDKPEILGGYLDVAATALKLKESVTPPKVFRLADFTRIGYIITQALGKTPQDFIDAFEENVRGQHEEVTHSNLVARAFLEWCEKDLQQPKAEEPYNATPENVFFDVQNKATAININVKNKAWPKAAHIFTRKLNEARESIAVAGWQYEIVHNGKNREFNIWTTQEPTPQKKPLTSTRTDPPYSKGKCAKCYAHTDLEFEVTYDDKSKELYCYGCGESLAQKIAEAAS